jgi:uncharacterized membrane protein
MRGGSMNDQKMEIIIANLLRAGVILAAAVVLVGGVAYLIHHGGECPEYQTFHGKDSSYRTLHSIATGAIQLDALAVIQLGLLLLIATPIARVAFSLVAFHLEQDRMYVAITAVVLAVLLYGLFAAH